MFGDGHHLRHRRPVKKPAEDGNDADEEMSQSMIPATPQLIGFSAGSGAGTSRTGGKGSTAGKSTTAGKNSTGAKKTSEEDAGGSRGSSDDKVSGKTAAPKTISRAVRV